MNNSVKEKMNRVRKFNSKTGKVNTFIKRMNMTFEDNEMQIQINGLYGKNYKIQFENHIITVSALRLSERSDPNSKKKKINFHTAISYLSIPYRINGNAVWTDVLNGMIHIKAKVYRGSQHFFPVFDPCKRISAKIVDS